jgi:hypothetical protein
MRSIQTHPIAALIIGIVLLGAGVGAQDYIFTHFGNGYQDHQLPPSPCGVTTLSASPVVYDRSVWVFYHCATGQHGGNGAVIARRFFHPNDNAVPPAAPKKEPVASITCPGGHPACVVLPDGPYPLAWADTVVGR